MVPAAENDLAVRQRCRVEIVALVKGNLLYTPDGAVIVHDVQVERKFVLVFVKRRKTRLAFIQQHRL